MLIENDDEVEEFDEEEGEEDAVEEIDEDVDDALLESSRDGGYEFEDGSEEPGWNHK
jgi:hypothetical protein